MATMNIVSDRDCFVWKGHAKLGVKHTGPSAKDSAPTKATLKCVGPGFVPSQLLQLHPPAAVTALILNTEWGEHGQSI